MAKKERRSVILCVRAPRSRGPGRTGRPLLWAFKIADIAALLGVSAETVRRMIRAGTLDPTSLESVVGRLPHRVRLERDSGS